MDSVEKELIRKNFPKEIAERVIDEDAKQTDRIEQKIQEKIKTIQSESTQD